MGNQRSGSSASASATSSRLDEQNAWDLAMQWHRKLNGLVTLDSDLHHQVSGPSIEAKNPSFRIVETVEWIVLEVPKDKPRKTMLTIRNATIVWFAISCCPGFGGHENPTFWKRVFSTYRPQHTVRFSAITDRERFFDHPDRPFPRIRFEWVAEMPLELLWEPFTPKQEKALRRVLRPLEPFVVLSRWQRTIPVAICEPQSWDTTFSKLLERLDLKHHHQHNSSTTERHLPAFDLVTIVGHFETLTNVVQTYTHAHLQVLHHPLHQLSESIPTGVECLLAQQYERSDPWNGVSVHYVDGFSRLPRRVDVPPFIASICSVLPHTTWIQGFGVVDNRVTFPFDQVVGAWLGYALFHPDAAMYNTSIENLTLRLSAQHRPAIQALGNMAQGNNLLVSIGRETTMTSGYFQARVKAGTMVHSEPNRGQLDEVAIFTFTVECWITLCSLPEEPSVESRSIVLSGHGIGWIQSTDILDTRCRSPSLSSVRRLRIGIDPTPLDDELSQDTKTVLFDLLSVLGDRLVYLFVDTNRPLRSTTVQSILQRCPNLTSLRLRHDGSCWADRSQLQLLPALPRLRELELTIEDALKPLVASQLDDLDALRVLCTQDGQFTANHDPIFRVLERYRRLMYFDWDLSYRHGATNRSEESDTLKQTLLARCIHGIHDTAQRQIGRQERLALLSAVCRFRLPHDVLGRILSFSTNTVWRQLHIFDA